MAQPPPIAHFEKWFEEAKSTGIIEPNAMTLATVTAEGTPDARIVLLKELNQDGFHFFTNYLSAKGRQLAINYSATLVFFWPALERQVRIKGVVQRASEVESDAYFATRPKGSQIASIASPQSEVVPSREWLEQRVAEVEASGVHKRPKHWGGFVVAPHEIEFWQGRENRLHDRLRYRKQDDGTWAVLRLAP